MDIRPYQPRDEESVVQLWTDCGLVVPWNDPRRDIQRKLKVQADDVVSLGKRLEPDE
jgi:hypothetical protein